VGFKKIQFMAGGGKMVKGLGKIAKRMMADDVMPAAEREANLAKFLEPSKAPMRLYHGTTATEGGKGTEAIRRIKSSKDGALGSGVYMTPNTNYADQYTYKGAGNYEGGNTLPVYAQIKNPLVIDGSASNDPMVEALIRLGMDEAQASRMVERAYENKGYIGKEVESRARAAGYDGLMQYGKDGELGEVVSYNPSAVKSAIGNRGTYDINEPDLSKADGGLAMAKGGKLAALGKIAKRLMADSDVLPTAEREANLTKFLTPSAEKRRMYHGSKEPNIKQFKTRKDMTDESMMTGHYADERDAVFLSPEPEFTKNFSQMGYTDTNQAPTTYPVYVQIEKPFDFDNPEHLKQVKETYKDMFHNPDSEFYEAYISPSERSMALHTFNKRVDSLPSDENNWARIENQDFQDVLKDIGFDSFYTRERGTKNLGVYEPNRIKSAIGNRGTYDLGEDDITKASGGLAMSDGGVLHMADAGKVVRGMAQVGKRLLQDLPVAPKVKPPSDNVANVRQANFQYPKTVGNQTVGIDKLSGGVRMSDPNEVKRVKALADQISSPEGYISRIIVDHNNNVIEGQHRLEALRQLGVKDVPVFKIEDLADTMPVSKMEEAMREVGGIRSDHVNQLMQHALDAISEGGIEGARQLNYGKFQKHYDAALNAITSDVKKADGGSVFKKLTFMADGGGAFKKISFYDKGGITTSGGTFSPEELGVNPSDLVADEKLSKKLKRGIAREMDIGKEQLEQEYRQLGNKGGKKDAAIRIGSQFLGSGSDLLNLGLEGIDLIQGAIPALSKPESVLDVTGDRVPKFKLASDKPFLGSQQFIDKFKEAKLLGENEFPLTELMAGFVAPAAAVGAFRKGKQAYKGAKALVDTPKKRHGGLTAMAR
jgi:hypothetical protein